MEQAYGFTPKRIQYHTLESALRSHVYNNDMWKLASYGLSDWTGTLLCVAQLPPYILHTQDRDGHDAMLPLLDAMNKDVKLISP